MVVGKRHVDEDGCCVQVISIGGDGKILVWKVDQKKGKLKLLDGWVQDEQCSLWSD